MNRRNFLKATAGCAVAPPLIRNAVVMVPKKFTMTISVTEELLEDLQLAGILERTSGSRQFDYKTRTYLISWQLPDQARPNKPGDL